MVKSKNHEHFKGSPNLEEYVSEKIKFISLTDYFVESRKDGRTKTLMYASRAVFGIHLNKCNLSCKLSFFAAS